MARPDAVRRRTVESTSASQGGRRRASAATSGCDQVMAVGGVRLRFAIRPVGLGQFVEIGVGIGVGGIDFVEPGLAALIGRRLLRYCRARPCWDRVAAPAAGSRCGCRVAAASPRISVSMPAMMRSRVDLPEPFRPSTPILAPGKNSGNVLRISRLGGFCPRGSWCRCIGPYDWVRWWVAERRPI